MKLLYYLSTHHVNLIYFPSPPLIIEGISIFQFIRPEFLELFLTPLTSHCQTNRKFWHFFLWHMSQWVWVTFILSTTAALSQLAINSHWDVCNCFSYHCIWPSLFMLCSSHIIRMILLRVKYDHDTTLQRRLRFRGSASLAGWTLFDLSSCDSPFCSMSSPNWALLLCPGSTKQCAMSLCSCPCLTSLFRTPLDKCFSFISFCFSPTLFCLVSYQLESR